MPRTPPPDPFSWASPPSACSRIAMPLAAEVARRTACRPRAPARPAPPRRPSSHSGAPGRRTCLGSPPRRPSSAAQAQTPGVDDRGGPRPARQLARPAGEAVIYRVDRRHATALEAAGSAQQRHVHGVAVAGGRVAASDPTSRVHATRPSSGPIPRTVRRRLQQEQPPAAADHGRELQQDPAGQPTTPASRNGGRSAIRTGRHGVLRLRVAVERPAHAKLSSDGCGAGLPCLSTRRLYGIRCDRRGHSPSCSSERDVRVGDVALSGTSMTTMAAAAAARSRATTAPATMSCHSRLRRRSDTPT